MEVVKVESKKPSAAAVGGKETGEERGALATFSPPPSGKKKRTNLRKDLRTAAYSKSDHAPAPVQVNHKPYTIYHKRIINVL